MGNKSNFIHISEYVYNSTENVKYKFIFSADELRTTDPP